MHRIAVIGRGLIGSAAARHLAEGTDGILCIGPDEPASRADHIGVFASHYDEGRMTRHVDPMAEWAITAGQSIARYRDLEARSGIRFYAPVGYLGLGFPGSSYNARCAETGAARGAAIESLDAAGIRARYPYLALPDAVDGLLETGGAGHISPRRMVAAQTLLAERAGATCIRQPVRAVSPISAGVEIVLWDGAVIKAEKALIAAGAFTGCLGLDGSDLGLTVLGRTTLMVRIEGDTADLLQGMPTMIDTKIGAYILPPIRYPDGHRYLKIGVGKPTDPHFTALCDLQAWFKGDGSKADRNAFRARLTALFPVLETSSTWRTDSCAVTYTKSGLPIIDWLLDDRIAVAVGGCGKGAKGSDEWGRIAAGLLRRLPWSSEVARAKLARPGYVGRGS